MLDLNPFTAVAGGNQNKKQKKNKTHTYALMQAVNLDTDRISYIRTKGKCQDSCEIKI